MADTAIKLPGIGPVKRQYVYAGGALVAGFVGFAWWQRSRGAGPPVAAESADDGAAPPGETGDSNVDVDHTGDTIRTNGQWTQAATEYLGRIGFEPTTIAIALGRYLGRQGLSAAQMDAVRAAVAALGPPPEGGPYPIQPVLPSPGGGDDGDDDSPFWPAPQRPGPPVAHQPAPKQPAPKQPAPKQPTRQRRHTVARGENLSTIAVRYYGTPVWTRIYNANAATIEATARRNRGGRGSERGKWIYPGTVLVIP